MISAEGTGRPALGAHRRHLPDERRFDQATIDALEDAADLAIQYGEMVYDSDLGIMAVPDIVLLELEAAGEAIPRSPILFRADGRTVALFRWGGEAP